MKKLSQNQGYGDLPPDPPRPVAGTPPRKPTSNDLIAIKHDATNHWLGPFRIVEIKTAPDGREHIAATRHDGSGGWLAIINGYGDGFNQWRFLSEVSLWTRSDNKIEALLHSLTGEQWRKLADWIAYGVAQ